ncbi:putative histone H3 [Hibiscus syriacus]|uniref:Histone H3 n=1 Tax=Hibiscus syriacus TaxID=106335 RepID=A0A6A3AHM0_HIBSY|nr:putative histone H3 [Hibiscus syriacus]
MSCPTTVATATHITNGVTSVDCQKQVRSWRLLRSLTELLIPTCNRTFIEPEEIKHESYFQTSSSKPVYNTFSSVITGTIFSYRRGKLRFCIQANSKSTNPILLLEFTVPTLVLAREMQGGILRIALDCTVKRGPSKADVDALRLMSSVVVGTGTMNGKTARKR